MGFGDQDEKNFYEKYFLINHLFNLNRLSYMKNYKTVVKKVISQQKKL